MRQRGQASAAKLAVVQPSDVEVVQRPRPPPGMTPEQSDEWLAIVNRMPADYFPPETHPVLVQLCRHTVSSRRVSQLIEVCERRRYIDLDRYEKLLKMQAIETRSITTLATKLRLCHQSTERQELVRRPTLTARPWSVDGEDEAADEG